MRRFKIMGLIIGLILIIFTFNLYATEYKFLREKKDRKEITSILKELKTPVTLFVFTQKKDCQYCELVLQISKELSSLSKKLKYKNYDIKKNKSIARKYNIKHTPSIAVIGKKDYGIRFMGAPVAYEFFSLLESIKLVSNREVSLTPANKRRIKDIDSKIDIDVFITPRCPYCPRAVITSFNIAFLNDKITARMIESYEFPEMAKKHNLSSVPKIVVKKGNKKVEFVGALPEDQFIQKVISVLDK